MPLCARCAGVYGGFLFFWIILRVFHRHEILKNKARQNRAFPIILVLVLSFQMPIEWWAGREGFLDSINLVRLLSGLGFGISLGMILAILQMKTSRD